MEYIYNYFSNYFIKDNSKSIIETVIKKEINQSELELEFNSDSNSELDSNSDSNSEPDSNSKHNSNFEPDSNFEPESNSEPLYINENIKSNFKSRCIRIYDTSPFLENNIEDIYYHGDILTYKHKYGGKGYYKKKYQSFKNY